MSAAGAVPVDSKSAKKRKAKADAVAANDGASSPTGEATAPSEPHPATNGGDSLAESSFIKDLTKYCLIKPPTKSD